MAEQDRTGRFGATRKEKAYLALIAVVLALIVAMLLIYPRTRSDDVESISRGVSTDDLQEPATVVRDRWIEVEKKITAEVLQDRLQDMGVLLTAEYYFTDLVSFSSVKTLFTYLTLPFTETSYMVRYDGVVSAGIDLSAASVEQDEARGLITVHIPKSSIYTTSIDLDSFELIEEKTGLGNPLSVQDVNASLQAFERSAEQKAVERGLLEKADKNAETMIAQFIGGVVNDPAYTVRFETDERVG